VNEVAHEASGTLEVLADSLRQGQTPPPMPPLPRRHIPGDPVSGELMERVPRQLEILHGAVEKLTVTVVLPSRRAEPTPA